MGGNKLTKFGGNILGGILILKGRNYFSNRGVVRRVTAKVTESVTAKICRNF